MTLQNSALNLLRYKWLIKCSQHFNVAYGNIVGHHMLHRLGHPCCKILQHTGYCRLTSSQHSPPALWYSYIYVTMICCEHLTWALLGIPYFQRQGITLFSLMFFLWLNKVLSSKDWLLWWSIVPNCFFFFCYGLSPVDTSYIV